MEEEGGVCALNNTVYAIQRANGASVFGWGIHHGCNTYGRGFFLLEKEKVHTAWSLLRIRFYHSDLRYRLDDVESGLKRRWKFFAKATLLTVYRARNGAPEHHQRYKQKKICLGAYRRWLLSEVENRSELH